MPYGRAWLIVGNAAGKSVIFRARWESFPGIPGNVRIRARDSGANSPIAAWHRRCACGSVRVSRSAATLLVALLALTPTTQAVCDEGCAPSPSSPANVVTTGQTDCGHGGAGSANDHRLAATGCGLDVPRILAIQAAPQHLQPAAGTPSLIEPVVADIGAVITMGAAGAASPPVSVFFALRI